MIFQHFAVNVRLLWLAVGCSLAVAACTEIEKQHTASANVQVLSAPVQMSSLQRSRTIRLYLPPSYATSDKRYPVLYMHDGQNLFDAATGYAGEWQVDETLDQLAAKGLLELIVVGIDNGGELRNQELVPFTHPDIPTAEGEQYLQFIVDDLKPLIDSQYRTLPDPAHTGLMGSSLGGLITHHAGQHLGHVFGRLGVLSPSYWVAVSAQNNTAAVPPGLSRLLQPTLASDSRWFVSMGQQEGDEMVTYYQKVTAALEKQRPVTSQLQTMLVPNAEHNEAAWAAVLEPALLFLFAEPANTKAVQQDAQSAHQ